MLFPLPRMYLAVVRARACRCGKQQFGSVPCNTWLRPTDARLAGFSAVCYLTVRELSRLRGAAGRPMALVMESAHACN